MASKILRAPAATRECRQSGSPASGCKCRKFHRLGEAHHSCVHCAIGLGTAAGAGGLGEALTASEATPCARKHGKLLPSQQDGASRLLERELLRAQAFFCYAYAEDLKLTSSCLTHLSTQLQQANLSAISRHQYPRDHASAHPQFRRGRGFLQDSSFGGAAAREWLIAQRFLELEDSNLSVLLPEQALVCCVTLRRGVGFSTLTLF